MDLDQGHDKLVGHGQKLNEVFQSHVNSEKSMVQTDFWLCVQCDLDIKVIRHVFGFWIEFLENEDIGIVGHFIVIDF